MRDADVSEGFLRNDAIGLLITYRERDCTSTEILLSDYFKPSFEGETSSEVILYLQVFTMTIIHVRCPQEYSHKMWYLVYEDLWEIRIVLQLLPLFWQLTDWDETERWETTGALLHVLLDFVLIHTTACTTSIRVVLVLFSIQLIPILSVPYSVQ